MKSIYNDVFRLVESEKSAISKKAFDVLNAEGIADIIENNGVFWFESYSMGNNCSADYEVIVLRKEEAFNGNNDSLDISTSTVIEKFVA